jgi:hypothetical protein
MRLVRRHALKIAVPSVPDLSRGDRHPSSYQEVSHE